MQLWNVQSSQNRADTDSLRHLLRTLLDKVRLDKSATINPAILFARQIAGTPAQADNVRIDLNQPVHDSAGHERTVYRPLLAYTIAQLGRADLHLDWFNRAAQLPTQMPVNGDEAIAWVWSALALQVAGAGREDWQPQPKRMFDSLFQNQQRTGAFLPPTSSVHPELRWYQEMVLLHAATTYAVLSPTELAIQSVTSAAKFQAEEIQPDHATLEPWALFAYLVYPDARMLADHLLHSVQLRLARTGSIDVLTVVLIADALYCLNRLNSA